MQESIGAFELCLKHECGFIYPLQDWKFEGNDVCPVCGAEAPSAYFPYNNDTLVDIHGVIVIGWTVEAFRPIYTSRFSRKIAYYEDRDFNHIPVSRFRW